MGKSYSLMKDTFKKDITTSCLNGLEALTRTFLVLRN